MNILKKSKSYDTFIKIKPFQNTIKSKSFNELNDLNYFKNNQTIIKIKNVKPRRRLREIKYVSNSPTIYSALNIIKRVFS